MIDKLSKNDRSTEYEELAKEQIVKLSKRAKDIDKIIYSFYEDSCQRLTYQKFFNIIEKNEEIKELTYDILFKFIDKIEIFQGEYDKQKKKWEKTQRIKIYYKFIGISIVN